MDLKIGSHTQPFHGQELIPRNYMALEESLVFPDRSVSGVFIAPWVKKGRTDQNCPLWSHVSSASGNSYRGLPLPENSLSSQQM